MKINNNNSDNNLSEEWARIEKDWIGIERNERERRPVSFFRNRREEKDAVPEKTGSCRSTKEEKREENEKFERFDPLFSGGMLALWPDVQFCARTVFARHHLPD